MCRNAVARPSQRRRAARKPPVSHRRAGFAPSGAGRALAVAGMEDGSRASASLEQSGVTELHARMLDERIPQVFQCRRVWGLSSRRCLTSVRC